MAESSGTEQRSEQVQGAFQQPESTAPAEKKEVSTSDTYVRTQETEEQTVKVSSPATPLKAPSSGGSFRDQAPFSPMVLSPSYYDDFGGDFVIYNRMPLKEICLAIALLTLGTLGIVFGAYMAYNKVWGDRSHGLIFLSLGALLFIPGFHETRIAYFAWIGYKGFSFGNIPAV